MKKKIPSPAAIKLQMAALIDIMPQFGEVDTTAIGAQIVVLCGQLSMDQIYDRWDNGLRKVFMAAIDARVWLDGDSVCGGDLVSEWKERAKCAMAI